MKSILVIGANSAIAEATARHFALRGDKLYLIARNQERLSTLKKDLIIRGATFVACDLIDINDFDSHERTINKAFATLKSIDIVLIAHGSLLEQKLCENSINSTFEELNTNAISTISLLTFIANKMEKQAHGTIAVITSVAGDRGRQSNYVYGAAKGMVSIFLQGLRNRLYKSGVNVVDIKPGFVDTPMTHGIKKGMLWAKPETVASDIVRGIDKGKNEYYTPFFWRYIMLIIRIIPESIFKRLKL